MKKFFIHYLLLSALIPLAISCSKRSSIPEITHLPFKTTESGRFGLIGTDGSVLIEDEFKDTPSVVVNGVFYVRNSDGTIEYFTANKKSKSLNGKTYLNGGYCTEGLIPVVMEEGQSITFLKSNGDIAFTFEEYNGQQIVAVNGYFSDGLCLFSTDDNKYGYLDTHGRVAIEPKYMYAAPFSEGLAVVDDETKDVFGRDFNIINTKGKVVAKLNADMTADKLLSSYNMYSDGLLYFGGKVFNRKGEIAFRLSDKIARVLPYHDGMAVFEDEDENYGLIDKKGEIIVRAKYESAGHIGRNRVFFPNETETDCIDFKGDRIFKSNNPILPVSAKRCITQTKKEYYFTNYDGKPIDKNSYKYIDIPSHRTHNMFFSYIYENNWSYEQWIYSDYYNASIHVASVLNALNKIGVGNITMGMSVVDLRKYYNMGESSQHSYNYWNNFEGKTGSRQLKTSYRVQFTEYIADYSGYNRNAKVQHIFINMDWSRIDVSNVAKRIREATISYLDRIGFTYDSHNDDWLDEAWDIYKSSNHNYLIAVNKDGSKLCLEAN